MKKRYRYFLGCIVTLILLIAVLSVFFEISRVDVSGKSMMPTLYPGDFLLSARYATFERYGIVVIDDPRSSEKLVKRIIGLPGEEIQIRKGYVFVNGVPLTEPYLSAVYRSPETDPVRGPLKIPPDSYYVLGDNRYFSRDSRAFGVVHQSAIHESVIAVISPPWSRKIFWNN